jgi:hypothetical protein
MQMDGRDFIVFMGEQDETTKFKSLAHLIFVETHYLA